jgi:hypothetical protein
VISDRGLDSWAALCNTRRQPADEINLALDNLVWEMARKVRAWELRADRKRGLTD